MHLWDILLPQAEKTVNMLRPARVTVSADAYMNGKHDFNAHTLSPLGMETEMHLKPTARETWEEHSAPDGILAHLLNIIDVMMYGLTKL